MQTKALSSPESTLRVWQVGSFNGDFCAKSPYTSGGPSAAEKTTQWIFYLLQWVMIVLGKCICFTSEQLFNHELFDKASYYAFSFKTGLWSLLLKQL